MNSIITGNLQLIANDEAAVYGDGSLQTASNIVIDSGYIELNDIVAPAHPGNAKGRLYKKAGDDGCYWKPDAAGAEVDLTGGGGGGGSMTIKEEGVDLAGAPHTTLNFLGTRITAADAGAGVASVTVAMPTTTKGDLMVHNGTDDTRLPVGTNNYVLTADSTQSTGLIWRQLLGQTAQDIQGVNSAVAASTNSTSFVDLNAMTLTATNNGTANYLVIFSQVASVSNAAAANRYHVILNVAGVDIAVTERLERPVNSNSPFIVSTSHYVANVANGSVIKIRWKATGIMTISSTNRELTILGFATP